MIGRSSRMSWCGREALPDDQEWSEGHPECPGVVGRPSRMTGSGREPSRVVGRTSQMSGIGLQALLYVWVWSGGLTGGRESHPDVREWWVGPHG